MMKTALRLLAPALALSLLAAHATAQDSTNFPTIGSVVRLDPKLDELLPEDARLQVVTSGFVWSEGPVWDKEQNALLFSDIPPNQVMKWTEGKGVEVYLEPSGYTGVADYGREPGSNGLAFDAEGRLLSCEHGDRRVSILTKNGGKLTLADNYEGKRFNSPNDLAVKDNGDVYFTDPPYGLPRQWNDPRRELDFCGVYRVTPGGEVTLLTKDFDRPNGIAFSPDQKKLYVAQSDPRAAIWKEYPVKGDGTLGEGKLLLDATEYVGRWKGLPDGLEVDAKGNLWASGPGGVWIISPEGKPLGRLHTGEATSNVGWGGENGDTLYITADTYILRVKTKTKGAGW